MKEHVIAVLARIGIIAVIGYILYKRVEAKKEKLRGKPEEVKKMEQKTGKIDSLNL